MFFSNNVHLPPDTNISDLKNQIVEVLFKDNDTVTVSNSLYETNMKGLFKKQFEESAITAEKTVESVIDTLTSDFDSKYKVFISIIGKLTFRIEKLFGDAKFET